MQIPRVSVVLFVTLVTLLAAGGCASGRPEIADAEVSQIELAIRSAENVGAAQYAPELLDRARSALTAAQNQRARRNEHETRELLEEARAAAVAAESKAKGQAARAQASAMKQQADELEKRTRDLNAGRLQ